VTGLIGRGVDRVDGPVKVTGHADYSADIDLGGLAHAVFVTSTIASGQITGIDVRTAEGSPGVLRVFTHQNLPPLARQPVWDLQKVTGMSFAPMQSDIIHYAGQPVAVVVAESLAQAEAAAAVVTVGYQAQAPVATLAHAEAGGGVFDPDRVMGILPARYRRGDADEAFARAAHLVRQDYTMSGQRQHPIELASTTATWDGDQLTLWETTQGLTMTQWNTSDALGVPPKNIRVISHYLGGGFGCKGSAWPHTWLAAQAARLIGRPVRLVLTRDQMSTSVGWREEQVHRITLACDDAGQLTGIRHVKTSATSPFDDFAEPSCVTAQMMYACPNVETTYRLARINAMTPVFMRGVGGNSGCFAVESALDELAYELSVDPVELRLRNHADVDPRSGTAWSSKSLKQCYDAAGKAIGWADRDPRPASMRKDGLQLGYGMSSAAYPVNQRELTEARIRVFSDNSAMVQCGAQDLGTGTYTIAAQIAAEELALDLGQVTVMLGDTDFPRAGNSTGAITSASVGNAVQFAARNLRQRIIQLAVTDPNSPLAGQAEDSITVDNGCLRSANLAKTDTYGEVLLRRQLTTLDGFSQWDPGSGTGISGGKIARIVRADTSSFSFGAWFAVVTVDPDLGLVRVERMAGAWAAGRILNPKTAANQMRGGGIMGIGQALLEGSATDPATARLLNPGLNEYLIPTHADAPPINVTFIEEHDPDISPLGSKGIGELPVVGAAPAIANAVFHATGRRIRHLPIMPEDLL
jgi:xanthine dehydrogenase YagR molybdenum-binding subunit